jgi:DUF1680 family protein
VVVLDLAMEHKRVIARPEAKADTNRVALQRGPLVYCVEGADNNGAAWNLLLPSDATFTTASATILSEPIIAIKTQAPVVTVGSDKQSLKTEKRQITAIPYYTWANRGRNPMQIWLPVSITDVLINY